ncbi:hypothetical protein [Iodobacter sp. BJB302]|uniref:hypothetical protein n=1 Tax=Iodobacter sp. BJB302 TaxID=1506510 RepID=UPI000C11A297|nr:hypothetical protein [Iodobacter sp. BJB302]PHV00775.1 hypothetical protein CSQ88_15580 [Iodobacter sp. BJB302]
MHAVYPLSDYPVLSELARSSGTTAAKLDGRACHHLYTEAAAMMDVSLIPAQELAFMRSLGFEPPGLESLVAITQDGDCLIARLSGGRVLRHNDAASLADLLRAEGVTAEDVRSPDWRAGEIAVSNGERIAILFRLRQAGRGSS